MRWSIVAVAALVGCASAPDNADRPAAASPGIPVTVEFDGLLMERYADAAGTHHRVPASADAVWRVMIQAYEEVGIDVATLDQASRRIGNTRLTARRSLGGEPLSRFFDCGPRGVGGNIANTHRLEIHVLTHVFAEGESRSRLQTQARATAHSLGASTAPTECASRGALEDRLARAVAVRLAAD